MTLADTARAMFLAGESVSAVRKELRSSVLGHGEPPTNGYVEECLRSALDCSRFVWDIARTAATRAFKLYSENVYEPVYLVGKRDADGIWRDITAERDGDLVLNDALPRHLTVDALTSRIRDALQREPVLPRVLVERADELRG